MINKVILRSVSILMFMGLMVSLSYGQDKSAELFQKNCSICHKISTEKLIGPGLAGVTQRRDKAWIAKFIRSSKTLIESGDKNQPAGPDSPNKLAEYTLYLEEDCPDRVVYYVFIDQSGLTPQQWIEWREKFYKSKAGEQFASAKSKLEQACTAGCGVAAELRFIQKDGELVAKSPEEVVRVDLKFAPIYDLNQQKKISK